MDDLVRRLRALSAHEHSDLTIGDEAADRIAELEAGRSVMRATLQNLSKSELRDSDSERECRQIIEEMRYEAQQALARIGAGCCNQPDQCWEPCGDLGKSEAHAEPVDTEDE